MALILETTKLAVPVLPALPTDLPIELTQFLVETKLYLDAVGRDLKKIGDSV